MIRPPMVTVPAGLAAQARLGGPWPGWLDGLPALARSVLGDWRLAPDGAESHGYCSLVLPVSTREGERAVLKLHVPDPESEHEHLALRHWAGGGAVRLLRADPTRYALLLERLSTTDLSSLPDLEACAIVAELYPRLHRPAFPQLRPLTAYVGRWLAALGELPRQAPVPRRLVEQALSQGAALVADPASTGRVVHGDLHFENVLAGTREPWLVIDPKPMSGDPHYEPAPLLWNRWRSWWPPATCGRRWCDGSTPWSTSPVWTRTGRARGWWCGWSSTPTGRSRTRSEPDDRWTRRTVSGSPAASPWPRPSRFNRPAGVGEIRRPPGGGRFTGRPVNLALDGHRDARQAAEKPDKWGGLTLPTARAAPRGSSLASASRACSRIRPPTTRTNSRLVMMPRMTTPAPTAPISTSPSGL